METLLNRYRNLTVLLVTILVQLVLLAYQIKSDGEVRLIRVWAIGAVTPLARVFEAGRTRTRSLLGDYLLLVGTQAENQRMKAELDRATLDNQYLQKELATADRARALAMFVKQSPSQVIAARVIGNATGAALRVVIIDRGASDGIQKGMAVITPTGIVGKITGVFTKASYVLLITDPSFAAGVISQKGRMQGTMRGQGDGAPVVERIPNEPKIEAGDWFYTSGDDRIFPKGLPAGVVASVRPGKVYQDIQIRPSGLQNGLEEVLVVLNGVHGAIPDAPANQSVKLLEPPPGEAPQTDTIGAALNPAAAATDADKLLEKYRRLGSSLGHIFGSSSNGAPNYNADIQAPQQAQGGGEPDAGATPAKP
jgi:rod shape-determining protein MreC